VKRKALLRDGEKFDVLEESEFEAEAALQEALKRNPEVIPVADLELAEIVVVGRETPVPAGAIDLLLVDAEGRVIILETKLSRNPELRRQAVAQVLDYGASLWRSAPSLREFQALVLRYWHSGACEDERVKDAKSLREGLEAIFSESSEEDWDYDSFETALEENLANGQHVLLLVATGLMDTLSRHLLQYANVCLDLPLYGVAIDVFETEARQLIVPRGVRYTTPTKRPTTPRARTDRDTFLAACTPVGAFFFKEILEGAERRGMIVYWGKVGFSVRLPLERPITVMYGFPPDEFQVNTGSGWLDPETRAEMDRHLRQVLHFQAKGEYSNVLRVDEATKSQALDALGHTWGEVDRIMAATLSHDEPAEPASS
jgi:hypothetical protein